MPLRYSRDRLKILKSVAALQQRGALDETLFRDFLRRYGKALRELHRLEDKAIASPDFKAGGSEFHPEREIDVISASVAEMWAAKRARQAADIAGLNSGELTADDVNWFAGGIARKAKVGPLFGDDK